MSLEETFGMIKPEGIMRKLEDYIESRITNAGLCITEKKKIIMSDYQFSLLYGHVEKRRPEIYAPMKDYMTTNLIMDICMDLKRSLKWDPVKEEFVGDAEANRMRSRAMREPWRL